MPALRVDASEGELAVALARDAVTLAAGPPPRNHRTAVPDLAPLPPVFREARGVFVTLRSFPGDELRGCIGFPSPVFPLGTAIVHAAVAAAREDPRFRPVAARELVGLTVEVSVLTIPEPVPGRDARGREAMVRVGTDGLIIDLAGRSGLLLPQVAPEQGWGARELLEGVCEKAGLPRDAWTYPEARLRRFQAEIFREERPPPR